MSANQVNRRRLLATGLATGAAISLGDLGFLSHLNPVSAAEASLDAGTVRLDSGIGATVRLLEETPRDKLLEEIAARIRRGLSYREILAALQLAGVKNVEPRPSVGHKFHSVLVVNSAHLASMSSPPEHRWLPIFWALDYYKSAAARDVQERGDWTMAAVDPSLLLPARRAHQEFLAAMDRWDEGAADVAIATLARTAGANEIYEMLFRYGARDFRSIGHKAIFVANSYRTLMAIGWQHAEPVLRSLVYALLMHESDNPAQRDAEADRPYRRNLKRVKTIPAQWRDGRIDSAATVALLQTLRSGSNDETCDHVVRLLKDGIHPTSIWDALHVGAGELLMKQPGIIALHAVTTTNALYFAFRTSANDETRRLLLLQNAAFLPMFRDRMPGRGDVRDFTVDDLEPDLAGKGDAEAIETIFANLDRDPMAAARGTLGFLQQSEGKGQRAREFMNAARVLIFLKGSGAHDYKFSSAILEDYHHVSPAWRDKYLALNVFKLRGSLGADNALVERTRAALTSV